MARLCLCLTGKTLDEDMELINSYRKYIDLAELRVDCLDPGDRLHIRRFPEMAGIPVILTIRRSRDGGMFVGGEGARITLLANGLAHAEADRRRNFAFVDLEEDLDVPSLEEAARAFDTRIIRSMYNLDGVDDDLVERLRRLQRFGDEIVKASVMARSLDEVVKVYQAARETENLEKILHCMGEYGFNTTVLAEFLGSRISYSFPPHGDDQTLAQTGAIDPKELSELYRFQEITGKTRVFAVTGYPLKTALSPRFFNKVFEVEKNDAVFIPIPADSAASLLRLAEMIGISGISVTSPFKEDIIPLLSEESKEMALIGACNTIVAGSQGWKGYNTDAAGFSDSLLAFSGRKDFRGRRFTILGAGGSARAVAAEVFRLKGKALILNRSPARARSLAESYGFAWAGLDSHGASLMERYSDFIIQASPVGMEEGDQDPIDFYRFSGRETFMDLIYSREKTPCLKRAEEAGCRILNGSDMFHRQVSYQYGYFMNKEFPPSLISRIRV
ncbi:MAG: type I 3-dehydroquinate dehydratase [Treponema sp.]|nr:type I 3-dehydroquinate dehydratase [Treponema sp.]